MTIQVFKVIQGYVFWGKWKGDKGLNNVGFIAYKGAKDV